MYAVIATGGKQYRVGVGDVLDVERLAPDADGTVRLRPVMLVGDDGAVTVDSQALSGASVTASVVEQRKAPKVVVFTYKNKTRNRTQAGHRQRLSRIRVDEISA
ncbi:MAG: 50S ribosomal protein L21 [Actinomycetota bacterium]|nr:50S ribosomal protein L21 [Actinomycetota bacterium]